MPKCRGGDSLQFLMDEHSLAQSGLPEVGSQGVVSEIIHGKRELNVRQIRALARRFKVSPAAFIYIGPDEHYRWRSDQIGVSPGWIGWSSSVRGQHGYDDLEEMIDAREWKRNRPAIRAP